jgi:hypothetical protein
MPNSLETIYENQLIEATKQNQTLVLRNYFRWKFLDLILVDLRSFLDDAHNNPKKGKSVRAITQSLNQYAKKAFNDDCKIRETGDLMEKAFLDMQDLAKSVLSGDVREKVNNAFHGSPRGKGFDFEKFLQTISKNALTKLMRSLEIEMRDYGHRSEGAGYADSRGPGSPVSKSMKAVWENPDFCKKQSEIFRGAWTPKRRENAAKIATGQMKNDPQKPFRMVAAREEKQGRD